MLQKQRTLHSAGAVLTAGLLAAGCAVEATTPPKYQLDQCARVSLIDAASGQSIVGAEDIAYDAKRGRLYVSAYDRRQVERAARKKAFSIPQGGLYAVSLDDIVASDGTHIDATPIVRADDFAGGLRPHGISFDESAGEIAFINRTYQRLNGRWRMSAQIRRVGADGEVFVGADEATRCSANDLIAEPDRAFISFDHESCGWRAALEDIMKLRRSGVAAPDGKPLFDDASFANGIVRAASGEIVMGATRESSVLFLKETAEGLELKRRVETPGGPDNLTVAPNGNIIAAVHPSLLALALDRRLGIGAAPSRIVSINPDEGGVDVLYDDPNGELFNAATVAVEFGDLLVAGSVTDEGLLICKAAG